MNDKLKKIIGKEIKSILSERKDKVLQKIQFGGLWEMDEIQQIAFESPKRKGSGLMVSGNRELDNKILAQSFNDAGMDADWSVDEKYWWFPAEEEDFEQLESDIEKILAKHQINASIESIAGDRLEESILKKFKKRANLNG